MPDLNLISQKQGAKPSFSALFSGNILFILSFLVLFATVSVWGGITIYKNTLEDEIEIASQKIKTTEDEIRAAGEVDKKLRNINLRLASLETLLAQHTYTTQFFDFLEDITHSHVKYDNFSLDVTTREADLSGDAASYGILAEQLAIINKSSLSTFSNLSNIALNQEGGISFSLRLLVHPKVFQKEL